MQSKSSILDELNKHGKIIYSNVGDSMYPFIRQGRDLLVIETPKEWKKLSDKSLTKKLRKYDIPLYRRNGKKIYVLHRVIKVREKDYVICGDNRWRREYGINDSNVVGVLTAVIRNGKEVSIFDKRYKVYVHLWCDLFFVRAAVFIIRDLVKKVTRSIKRRVNRSSNIN